MAARGAGEEDSVATRGAGEAACGAGDGAARGADDGAARGAGEEVVGEGRGDASSAQVEAPEDGPADKNLCGDPIGASTVSDASKNSRVAGVEGPSRSAKGSLIKDDVSGDDYLAGRHVKAAVSFVVSRVTKKDTQGRTRSEFMGGCDG